MKLLGMACCALCTDWTDHPSVRDHETVMYMTLGLTEWNLYGRQRDAFCCAAKFSGYMSTAATNATANVNHLQSDS